MTGASLLLAGFLGISLFSLFDNYQREILKLEKYMSFLRYKGMRNPSGIMFGKEIDLNTTIKGDRKTNSRMIMLRVMGCDAPPGYLRGRIYQYYSNGKWRITAEEADDANFQLNIDGLAINAFFMGEDPGSEGKAVNIYHSDTCYAKFLFLPGNTKRIEMVADRVDYTKNGHFIPKQWEKDGGYTAKVSKIDQFSAFPGPVDFVQSQYLPVPSNLSHTAYHMLHEIYGLDPVNDAAACPCNSVKKYLTDTQLTDREITEKVVTFFHNKFQYTLEPEAAKNGEEPLTYFMTKTRSGHCELFASSAAMVLRKMGIPTRYVTGLLCHEVHPSGKYYVSRLGDAHAWVEAYLRDEKKWIIVEATPSAPDDKKPEWGFFEVWIDRLKHNFQKIFADIRRGYVARAIISGVVDLFLFFWDVIKHPVGGILFIASVLILLWRYKFYKKRKYQLKLKFDAQILEIQKKMLRLEKSIEKKTGIRRDSQTTVDEWIEKIRKSQNLSNEHFSRFEKLVKLYQKLRFSTKPISEKEIVSLDKLMAECK